ncbi:MAG: DUF3786 domain-containing protein [Deltaproteobacteria bacterium]|nr:DUF3786 domain-containing protein [Deltaproteobacteria bacterium]
MTNQYEKIIQQNLIRIYQKEPTTLEANLAGKRKDNHFYFKAFGKDCCLTPEGIMISGSPETGPQGLLISLYALNAGPAAIQMTPFKAFKDLPNSMPYHGAFSMNSERPLIPYVSRLENAQERIKAVFYGENAPKGTPGDFAFVIYPLPMIALCYIFYRTDDEFPASCICLFSANAIDYMPIDGLADVGEYTSKRLIELI